MLHMIRQIIGDTTFRAWLHKLTAEFSHHTVNTQQILALLNDYTKKDLTSIFNQYLRTTQVPVFEYYFQNGVLRYRWSNCMDGFAMPLKVSLDKNSYQFIYPTTSWQKIMVNGTDKVLLIDSNFYVGSKKVNN